MDVFELRGWMVEDYARYTRRLTKNADERINARIDGGKLLPESLLYRGMPHGRWNSTALRSAADYQ